MIKSAASMTDLRYASDTSEYLFNLTPDKEIGMPENIGWHGLYMGDLVDGEGFSELPSDAQQELRNAAAVILYQDESGFIEMEIYQDSHEAEKQWEEIEDTFYEHYDQKDLNKAANISIEAYSASSKSDIIKLFGKKPGFPQEEEGVDTLLKGLQGLLPPSAAEGSGKQKALLVYLARQLFGGPRPTFVQPEDDDDIRDILAAFEEAQPMLPPDKKDINKFKAIQDIKAYLEEMAGEKEQGLVTLASLPDTYSCKKGITEPGNPKAEIAAGAQMIAQAGDWQLYEIKRNQAKSPGRVAAGWLTCNELWNVSWCTGRDRSQNEVSYQTNGDFWVLTKGGRSKWAISSSPGNALIYDVNDKSADIGKTANQMPKNTAAKAAELGVTLGGISSIPPEIIPVMAAGAKASKSLSEVIPASSLSVDFSGLDQVVKAMNVDALIEDVNNGTGSNAAQALLGRALANRKSFSGKWDKFNEDGMIAFINAWAATGAKNLPPDLEQAFIDDAPNFRF